MAWVSKGVVPMFPHYFDFGEGSYLTSGANPKSKWMLRNTSSDRTINILISVKKKGATDWDESFGRQFTIPPGTDWYLSSVTYYTNAGETDSLGVRATLYDDYGFLSIYRDENTAPTTPGTFTQPTGILETGDRKTISWGASTDAQNNLAYYILEVSINSGAWTHIGTPAVNNFTYTIPAATNIQFRVKARDSEGLDSAYRTSGAFTVQLPQYYWNKYNVISELNYDEPSFGPVTKYVTNSYFKYPSYEWDKVNGTFKLTGTRFELGTIINKGFTAYGLSDGNLERYVLTDNDAYLDKNANYDQTVKLVANRVPKNIYSRGTLVQSGIIAIESTYPTDGRGSDGFWYIRGSRVNQSIAPPQAITSPATDTVFRPGNIVNIAFTASTAANISAYEVDYRYNNGTWMPLATNATLTRTLTVTTDSTKTTLEFRIRAKNTSNVYSDYIFSPIYTIQHNVAPVVTLNTENNKTLYENDSFEISGTVQDVDNGNTVTVRYQISGGNERAIKAYLSNGSEELFSKALTFKGGKIYDGETLIAGDLVDGTPYTVQVWATDDKGGKSAIAERTFYVVPNRAPALTVNTPVIMGNIDSDEFEISGSYNDLDNNTTNVAYRINGGSSMQVASGTNGDFNFKLKLGQLQVGLNSIVIEAIDSYGAKTSRTVKLEKNEVKTEQLKSTVRYKIIPPLAKAKGVILWVRRDKNLTLSASISMTQLNEAEDFVPMIKAVTAPISNQADVVEDQFEYESTVEVDNIILQLDMQRSSLTADEKIYLLLGVID